jgi:pSer/pThr/pTyr-binding forkhead associated (FHA) protein
VPFIEYDKRLFRLKDGSNVLASDEAATIRLPDSVGDYKLTISVEDLGTFAWSPNDSGRIVLNGRPLKKEPIPLFHGDRFTLNGSALVFIDDGGENTIRVDSPPPLADAPTVAEVDRRAEMVELERMMRMTPPEPEVRLVAVLRRLDNNQAYIIDQAGFRIGREKRSDLLIPDRSISRLHAEITCDHGQYFIRCLGRTATKVNGKRIDGLHKLQVGDVIKVGNYEFAFSRRPLGAEEIVQSGMVTPIRSAVPEAPTVGPQRSGGSWLFTILIVIGGSGLAIWMLLS